MAFAVARPYRPPAKGALATAQCRRLTTLRRLRHAGDNHQRGLQRQLAGALGVVLSVICKDFKQKTAAGRLDAHAEGKARGTGADRRPHQAQEKTMSQRSPVGLPDAFNDSVQIEADARQCGLSDVLREASEGLLG